jgi:hypothetical protein
VQSYRSDPIGDKIVRTSQAAWQLCVSVGKFCFV